VKQTSPPPARPAVPGGLPPSGMATAQEIRENSGKPGWIQDNWARLPR
jgi:hypothetical protein